MVSQKPGRARSGVVIFEVVGHGVFGGNLDPGRDDFCEERAGERCSWNADEQRVEDGAAYVGVIGVDGEKRGGVRRDESVIDRERGNQRQGDTDEGGCRCGAQQ